MGRNAKALERRLNRHYLTMFLFFFFAFYVGWISSALWIARRDRIERIESNKQAAGKITVSVPCDYKIAAQALTIMADSIERIKQEHDFEKEKA